MRADLIDIQVETKDEDVVIALSGILGKFQVSAVREKIDMLTKGSGCFIYLDLQHARFKVDDYLEMFLELLNKINAQGSTLILIFNSEELNHYFAKYRNIFEIHSSRESYKNSGLLKQLRQIGIHYAKKTGLRLSPSVAIASILLVIGWMITLFLIIAAQGRDIAGKQAEIIALQGQRDRYVQEIEKLESSIGPLRKLGVVQDTSLLNTFGAIQDWASYLEYLENNRREK